MSVPSMFHISGNLFGPKPEPKEPLGPDPKMQAFLEDLVAVYAKHGKYVEYDGLVTEMEPDIKYAVVDSKGDILFGEQDPRTADKDSEWDTDEPFRAVATVPTTAHSIMAAHARVAAIRAEGATP